MEIQSSGSKRPKDFTPAILQQEFLFVDASKSAKQGRRHARSFLMQKVRKARPWSTSKHLARARKASGSCPRAPALLLEADPTSPSALCDVSVSSFLHLSCPSDCENDICAGCGVVSCHQRQYLCARCSRLSLLDISGRMFDPFGTVSVNMDNDVSQLLNHFVSEMAPVAIPVDVRRTSTRMCSDWFGTAIRSSGFMYSLLCTAALHQLAMGIGSIERVVHYRAQAIAAINAAISSPDVKIGISDANIGAVFNLFCVEDSLQGPWLSQWQSSGEEPDQRQVHLDGLRRMVDLRGGLMALASNRLLQSLILWHSAAYAVASFTVPDLHASDYLGLEIMLTHPPGRQLVGSEHLAQICRQVGVTESLASMVDALLVLIAELNVWYENIDNTLDPLDIQNYACVLQILLVRWTCQHEGLATPLEGALSAAMIIFTVRVTEAMQRRSDSHVLHAAASQRLEVALQAANASDWPCLDLLLWILAIAAVSANGSSTYSWFVVQVSLTCATCDILTYEQLLARLQICGWVSFKLDGALRELWVDMKDLRMQGQTFPPLELFDAYIC